MLLFIFILLLNFVVVFISNKSKVGAGEWTEKILTKLH
jgi:hypothetical protein